jgi:hypothetical protein
LYCGFKSSIGVDLNSSFVVNKSTKAATKLAITKQAHGPTSTQVNIDQYYKYVVLVLLYITIGNMPTITLVVVAVKPYH